MRRKDIVENPFKKFQQGVAKGFTATQKGGAIGPDSLARNIKTFFTSTGKPENKPSKDTTVQKKGTDNTDKKDKKDNIKPGTQTSTEPLDPKKPIPNLVTFTDGRIKYDWNPKKGKWISTIGGALSAQDGIKAYNKTDKNKREFVIENKSEDKNMNKAIKEGLADLAGRAEADHEVQMARADLYKIAKYAIKLHDMLKDVSEEQGLEGWVQAKITKSADYIGSVYHNLDYDMKFGDGADEAGPNAEMQMGESRDTHCSDKCCGSDVKREDCKCPPDCKHCNCNATNVDEGKYKNDAQRKAVHASKAKKDKYKESIAERLAQKLSGK